MVKYYLSTYEEYQRLLEYIVRRDQVAGDVESYSGYHDGQSDKYILEYTLRG